MKSYEVLLAIDCLLKVHQSIFDAWTKDATIKRTLKKVWLHRSMAKLLSPLVLSLVGATDTLFMLEKSVVNLWFWCDDEYWGHGGLKQQLAKTWARKDSVGMCGSIHTILREHENYLWVYTLWSICAYMVLILSKHSGLRSDSAFCHKEMWHQKGHHTSICIC